MQLLSFWLSFSLPLIFNQSCREASQPEGERMLHPTSPLWASGGKGNRRRLHTTPAAWYKGWPGCWGKERKKKTPPPLVHQLGPQGCLQPRKSLLCPTASALEVTWLQLPQSALAPWIKALPSGRVSGSRATVLSCSSPPGKHFHFLITPESPPQSLPRQM